ncbi:unnamed protein product [Musa acuminata subsp. malaccensis]|uniref:(wild Malaysian banana) hypothetical protein n=1 Tax=Musa acuminata subsp. malaccensis TaxID=214687 RepID=A0A804I614_MUSAM|nr:PREDICTED: uncharacterized protein LOC103976766 [Musa acuminata subsp. malaccensis]CAG1862914.1 unnamed protein product [Musa acuminata subsp. malaccensis]
MASTRPSSHRYASVDSRSSSDPPSPSSDRRNPTKNLSSLRRLVTKSSGRQAASEPVAAAPAVNNSSRALVDPRDAKTGHNFGSMVRKLMEKRSNPKPGSASRAALVVPSDPIAEDLKKGAKGSHFSALSRKLFQKGGTAERTTVKALMETKTNARTLAMVLRSERELLTQNKEYEAEISELRLLIEEKNQKIEKLKDLCLKQREEIKALKDAILFPDVMNSQLQELLEKQGFELKQANQVIPTLQKQVTSLTGQLQCLAEDLAEVKADKYSAMSFLDGHISSPTTPVLDQEAANPLEYSSGDPLASECGSPDEMFLKDLNPCLTPCFSKTKSQENNELVYGSPNQDRLFQLKPRSSPSMLCGSHGGKLSRSSEHRHRPSLGSNTAQKVYKSDENKHPTVKPRYQTHL